MPELDPADLAPRAVYLLLTSLVTPRPIAWVSTVAEDGTPNLAPHSYFNIASSAPPIVHFTSTGVKDSLRNARATGEFVVSVCTEDLIEQVNLTGTDYPSDVSEFDAVAGLTREPSRLVAPPRVAESPVALECRLLETKTFGDSTVVFGEVVWAVVSEDVLLHDRPEVTLLKPVSRLGADEWGTAGAISSRKRVPFSQAGR